MTMNLKTNSCKPQSAVALVITLLMLAVITFLAIAFLAMTSRDKSAATASLDYGTAKSMSDSALARAQAEIIARMMAANDILNYDYMASHNYITPQGFTPSNSNNVVNVNYDYLAGGTLFIPQNDGNWAADWAQNIANLYYDPRPPVFLQTNANPTVPYDFRFYVDLNRNGRFETNGMINTLDQFGNVITNSLVNGEPEWIGVLKYPETNHSVINPFIGRYAYMVLPIGKELDFNFIHNAAKFAGSPGADLGPPNMQRDGYNRNEGVGSWELNLAALINAISPEFQTNQNVLLGNYAANPYVYYPSTVFINPDQLGVTHDAAQFVAFRYGFNPNYPKSLGNSLAVPAFSPLVSNIDEFGLSPSLLYPFDYQGNPPTGNLWPGTYSSNTFYDPQDLFDVTKVGSNFANNLLFAGTQIDTTNRYTFQRLLDSIGTGSSPEYGVYVYSNFLTTNAAAIPPQNVLRTKVNINYDNTAQIQAGPYDAYGKFTPMPTNLAAWTPLGFFTNAAESLLRSQVFTFTNYYTNAFGQLVPATNVAGVSPWVYMSFGLTNIPVYVATNPGICYNEQVHRMLQLAANIYADAYPSNGPGPNPVQQPPVFRPIFYLTNGGTPNAAIYITGFAQVTGPNAYQQMMFRNWDDPTNALLSANGVLPNDNVWGVPWVVGAVKGIPQFDQYSCQTRVYMQRKLQFLRYPDPAHAGQYLTTKPPQYTNQFYEMAVSNNIGFDVWNPYSNNFVGSTGNPVLVASNYITLTITNNYRFRFVTNIAQVIIASNIFSTGANYWPGGLGSTAFKTFFQTNFTALPLSFFSESSNAFVQATNQQSYPSPDTNQTKWATHDWVVTVTNHLYYALLDGLANQGNVLDFVNLGPFGNSFDVTTTLVNSANNQWFSANPDNWWAYAPGTDAGSSSIPTGVQNQINDSVTGAGANATFRNSIQGASGGYPATIGQFGPPTVSDGPGPYVGPYASMELSNVWMICDPLVHYTLGDLTYPGYTYPAVYGISFIPLVNPAWSTSLGSPTTRYITGAANGNVTAVNGTISGGNMVIGDPGLHSPNDWNFPTNLFPGVGWLGRVHRGTPWQTVYLKPDDPNPIQSFNNWYIKWVNSPFTYPTNDWSLIDLFTAVPNDNAARGLLSVNQTNAAAWAAVFGGVIAITNSSTLLNAPIGEPIWPGIDPPPGITGTINGYPTNVYYLVDYTNGGTFGINWARANPIYHPNGLFHKIGEILQATSLTTGSPFITNAGAINDEMVERIPQQTLGLLKLGMPQFVIYAWGQSLRPKNLYSGSNPNLVDLCTNYEITGEYLTRTVCHLASTDGVATNAPRIVVDSFNIEPNP